MPDSRLQGLLVPYHLLSDFSHWRHRAAEFRALAGTVEGEGAKESLLRMADHYDKLAKSAEERLALPRPVSLPKIEITPQIRPLEAANPPLAFSLKRVPFAQLGAPLRFSAAATENPSAGISGQSEK